MERNRKTTQYYAKLALLTAVLVVLSVSPIGSIPLPHVKATTTHIPVIIGAILLGPGAGVFLGMAFGVMSVIRSTLFPTPTTFVFSPFLPVPGSENGSVKALIVAFVPRILIGLVAAVLYQVLHSKGVSDKKACFVCGIVGSSVNTVFVIVFIYLLFGAQYAAALGATYELLIGLLMGVVVVNGIPELIIASILTAAVCCPILRMQQKKR